MAYPRFDLSKLELKPLATREHDMCLEDVRPLQCDTPMDNEELKALVERIIKAKEAGSEVILMMGAHVIKTGMSRFIIDLMEKGYITHLGMNGACMIHDYELAMIGASTESVPRYISEGQFGLWQETGQINTRQIDWKHDQPSKKASEPKLLDRQQVGNGSPYNK
jgi:hypothetical protein